MFLFNITANVWESGETDLLSTGSDAQKAAMMEQLQFLGGDSGGDDDDEDMFDESEDPAKAAARKAKIKEAREELRLRKAESVAAKKLEKEKMRKLEAEERARQEAEAAVAREIAERAAKEAQEQRAKREAEQKALEREEKRNGVTKLSEGWRNIIKASGAPEPAWAMIEAKLMAELDTLAEYWTAEL